MRHGIVILVLLYIASLIAPPPAEAGCTWILWEKREAYGSLGTIRDWEPSGGYATSQACTEAQQQAWDTQARTVKRLIDMGEAHTPLGMDDKSVGYRTQAGELKITHFKCLPDTVDPRIKP